MHSSDYTIRRTGNIPDEATFQVYIEISHWLLHKKFENYSSEQLISFEMNWFSIFSKKINKVKKNEAISLPIHCI